MTTAEKMRVVIATHNAHKTIEFRALLGVNWEVEDLSAFPEVPVPEESGITFLENASIKALSAAACLPEDWLVVADDSGLEVDALEGRPGVYSARYAGRGAGDAANRDLVLEEMRGKSRDQRGARFRCVLAVAHKRGVLAHFEGTVEGHLTEGPAGSGGFGYDSIFMPAGHARTFGELPPDTKNNLSHRAKALGLFTSWLQDADLTNAS